MARTGDLVSFVYLAEHPGNVPPEIGVLGRWRSQPMSLVGELEALKLNMARLAWHERYDSESNPGAITAT